MTTFPLSTTSLREPVYTADELRQITAARDEDQTGLVGLAGDAVNSEWSTSWFARWSMGQNMPVDPDFRPTPEVVKELGEGIDPSLWGEFAKAESLTHAYYIRESLRDVNESRDRLARAGVTGAALQIGSAILDPGFIAGGFALEAATGGGATPLLAAKAGRLQGLIRSGLLATATDVPIQAFISSQDPEQGTREVLFTLAGGIALGGGLGALGSHLATREARAAARLQKDLQFEELEQTVNAMGSAGQRGSMRPLDRVRDLLTPKGKAYFAEQADPAIKKQRLDDAIAALYDPDRDGDIIDGLRAMEPDEALRTLDDLHQKAWNPTPAAGTKTFPRTAEQKAEVADAVPGEDGLPPEPPPLDTRPTGPEDFDASWTLGGVDRIGETKIDKARGLTASTPFGKVDLAPFTVHLGRVNGRLTRIFGAASLNNDLLRKSETPIGDNAEVFIRRIMSSRLSTYNRETGEAFRRFREARGTRNTFAERQKFNRIVTQAIREGWHGVDADIEAAASTIARLQGEVPPRMQAHGVRGFEEVQPDPSYLMRVYNTPEVHRLDAEYDLPAGTEQIFNQLLRKGILEKTPDLPTDKLDMIVAGVGEQIRSLDKYQGRGLSAMLDGTNGDALADLLRDFGMPEPDIAQILYRVEPRDIDAGKINRAKHRLLMDETVSVEGPDGRVWNLQQFLEDDADVLFASYLRETTGAAASREVYRAVSLAIDPDGGVDIHTWKELEGVLAKELDDEGHTAEEIGEILKVAEMVDRNNRGLPIRDRVAGQDFWRRMRNFGHVVFSGPFGLNQQIETAGLVGEAGYRATLQQVPALKEIIGASLRGEQPNMLIERIEAMTGVVSDHVNARYMGHFDFRDAMEDSAKVTKTDRFLHGASRVENILSLQTPTMIIQKKWGIMLSTQDWLNYAATQRIPSAKRLAQLGMTEDLARKVASGVKEHAIVKGGRMVDLDLDKWLRADPATAGQFVRSLDRWLNRVIQRNDLGSAMPWTTSVFGRIVTQFRTFPLHAWDKQFLHRAQMHDNAAFVGAAASFVMSMLVYTARQHLQAAGRADREQFLAERMSTRAVVGGAFRYSGFASFMPDVVDTVLPPKYRLFSRSSGLSTSIFDAGTAPVPAMLTSGFRAVGTVTTAPLDGKFTRDEWRSASRLIPFRNLIGIRNIIEGFETRLPEDDE